MSENPAAQTVTPASNDMMSMMQTMMMENRKNAIETRSGLASMERKITGAKDETKSMITAANFVLQKAMDLQMSEQLKVAAEKADATNKTILDRLLSLEKARNEDSISTTSGSVRSAATGQSATSRFYNASNHAVLAPGTNVTALSLPRGGFRGHPQGNDYMPNRVWLMGWKRELSSTFIKKFAREVVADCCPLSVSSLVSYDAGNVSKVCSLRFPDIVSAKFFVQMAQSKDLRWFDKVENVWVQINAKAERSLAHRAGFKFLGEVRSKLSSLLSDEHKATTEISSNGLKGGIFFSDNEDSMQIAQVSEVNCAYDVKWCATTLDKYGLTEVAPGIRDSAIKVIQAFTSVVYGSRPFSR